MDGSQSRQVTTESLSDAIAGCAQTELEHLGPEPTVIDEIILLSSRGERTRVQPCKACDGEIKYC